MKRRSWYRVVDVSVALLHTALERQLTAYDALYVLLTMEFVTEFVTVDEFVAVTPPASVRLLRR